MGTKTIWIAILTALTFPLHANDKLVDEGLTKNAVAVLRVQLMFSNSTPSNTFTWYVVHVNHVFNNESNQNMGHDFPIGAFKEKSGVPQGECTVYLTRYDVPNKMFSTNKNYGSWVLVGGDATSGVSHVDSGAKLN
ncbi:MAG: hypothetical protein JWR19_800 [Pedosphaera sp.]|nr:hypothetical protein [Pedosphaera sp.]